MSLCLKFKGHDVFPLRKAQRLSLYIIGAKILTALSNKQLAAGVSNFSYLLPRLLDCQRSLVDVSILLSPPSESRTLHEVT